MYFSVDGLEIAVLSVAVAIPHMTTDYFLYDHLNATSKRTINIPCDLIEITKFIIILEK